MMMSHDDDDAYLDIWALVRRRRGEGARVRKLKSNAHLVQFHAMRSIIHSIIELLIAQRVTDSH